MPKDAEERPYRRGQRKLTEREATEIKYDMSDLTQKELGEKYGITQGAVWKIKAGITWRHI